MGTKEKELTGYPSIDKPWLKYYKEEDRNDCTCTIVNRGRAGKTATAPLNHSVSSVSSGA